MGDAMVRAAALRLRKRSVLREQEREERRQRAQSAARAIAEVMGSTDPSVERIIGFGSAFETWRTFTERSDIDLAVEGGDWFMLHRNLPVTEFEVSIVELAHQNPEFVEHVRKRGTLLYEKHDR